MTTQEEQGKKNTQATKKDIFAKRKYIYAVGRRKEAVAQVRVFGRGKGIIVVNGKTLDQSFPFFEHQQIIQAPFAEIGKADKYDVSVKVLGGGVKGQAESVRLGIARCLVQEDEEWRKALKAKGYLMRDPRSKERKKPGLQGARRAPQWKKR